MCSKSSKVIYLFRLPPPSLLLRNVKLHSRRFLTLAFPRYTPRSQIHMTVKTDWASGTYRSLLQPAARSESVATNMNPRAVKPVEHAQSRPQKKSLEVSVLCVLSLSPSTLYIFLLTFVDSPLLLCQRVARLTVRPQTSVSSNTLLLRIRKSHQ